jgi:hypothetical protein
VTPVIDRRYLLSGTADAMAYAEEGHARAKVVITFWYERLTRYFVREVPDIDVQKIIHFGMGMFWKAAIHSWKGGVVEPRIDLGPYAESIRKYLRCESGFPKHCYLVVNVAPPDRAQISLFAPYLAENKGWHVYYAYVPGLLFMPNVGRTVADGPKALSISHNSDRPILSSGYLIDKFEAVSKEQILGAKQTHSFLQAMEKVAKEKETL